MLGVHHGVGVVALAVGVGTLAATAVAGCDTPVRAYEKFSFTADWRDYQRVVIRTGNGSIKVTADASPGKVAVSGRKFADGSTLIEAQKYLKQVRIVAEPDASDPRTLRIEVHRPNVLHRGSLGANLHVRVPKRCKIEADSGNGSIDCDGLGPLDLTTTNGAVRVHNATGPVEIDTSNGGIVLKNIVGDCRATTSNGEVIATGVRGNLHAETTNGQIEADVIPPADGRVILESSNGWVAATLPASLAGVLEASVTLGTVDLDAGSASVKYLTREDRGLEATLNGGGKARVRVGTTNGSIKIRFR